jgi:hypothetical protein
MTWSFIDRKFKKAIDVLSDYEWKCYSKKTVAKRMAEAEVKNKFHVREGLQATLRRHILIPIPFCL